MNRRRDKQRHEKVSIGIETNKKRQKKKGEIRKKGGDTRE